MTPTPGSVWRTGKWRQTPRTVTVTRVMIGDEEVHFVFDDSGEPSSATMTAFLRTYVPVPVDPA